MTTCALRLTCVIVFGAHLVARTQPAAPVQPTPTFDVVSAKQETSGEQPSNNWQRSPGRIDYQNTQILQLIRAAYGDFSLRVEGFPAWTTSERYDIDVRFPVGTPEPQLQLMLRNLLVERFRMVARLETREVPVYELVMARPDRTPGPQLKAVDSACAPGPANLPPECRARISVSGGTVLFPYNTMAGLARTLTTMQGFLGRPVTDRTGLIGNYNISLTFAPPPAPAVPGSAPAATPDAPSIFTALQEQLGLRLDPVQGSVQMIVIDGIERPTPN